LFLKMLFKISPYYWNTNGTRFISCSTYSLNLAAARFWPSGTNCA